MPGIGAGVAPGMLNFSPYAFASVKVERGSRGVSAVARRYLMVMISVFGSIPDAFLRETFTRP